MPINIKMPIDIAVDLVFFTADAVVLWLEYIYTLNAHYNGLQTAP